MRRTLARRRETPILPVAVALLAAACGDGLSPTGLDGPSLECSLDVGRLVMGNGGRSPSREDLPALTDPALVGGFEAAALYVGPRDRVIGFFVRGQPVAVPHNILWWHEVVNFNLPGRRLSVTYSPFTGSSLVFDRTGMGVEEFRVSPFLFDNNLVMEDPETGSLWPQMSRAARCGERDGTALPSVAFQEMEWVDWRGLHPSTVVVSAATGFDRPYSLYPYGRYERLENDEVPTSVAGLDPRRPAKERVLGVPDGSGGVAFPFGELVAASGDAPGTVARARSGGRDLVVFWSGGAGSALAFRPEAGGRSLEFELREDRPGRFVIVDRETETIWRFDGVGAEGPLEGERLAPVAEAYTAFWFAWAAFQPDTEIWTPGG